MVDNKHVLDYLLSIELDDLFVKIGNDEYKLDKQNMLKVFALNIILVLEKGRMTYRCDQHLSHLTSEIKKMDDRIKILTLVPTEPTIILKENLKSIIDIFNNEQDPHIAYGKMLEYSYVGLDWANGFRDTYSITYNACDGVNKPCPLYTFNVPIDKYTDNVKEHILSKNKLYNHILNKYGYKVNVDVMVHPKNGIPFEIILL